MYYLQSRYYDSAIGRFVNADNFASTGQGFIGFNMFGYCLSNPVNYIDSLMRKHKETLPLEFASNISYEESDTILELIDRKITLDEFHRLWSNVPAVERELLERKYFLLETDAEIASTMGIQKNSVRMALSRARKKAFAFLKDMADLI